MPCLMDWVKVSQGMMSSFAEFRYSLSASRVLVGSELYSNIFLLIRLGVVLVGSKLVWH